MEALTDHRGRPARAQALRIALVGLPAIIALGVLDGGVAGWAQWAFRIQLADWGISAEGQLFSLTRHVLAMLALSVFTVAVAVALARFGHRVLALGTVVGAVLGPMTILAAPVRVSLLSGSEDTRWWWHAVVQTPQLAVLLGLVWWLTRCLDVTGPLEPGGPISAGGWSRVSAESWFSVFAMAAILAQLVLDRDVITSDPRPVSIDDGCALLAAGVSVVALRPGGARAAGFSLAAVVGVLALMYLAYYRHGGWPGVAGWEISQPPIILSPASTVVLGLGPLIGLSSRLSRRSSLTRAESR